MSETLIGAIVGFCAPAACAGMGRTKPAQNAIAVNCNTRVLMLISRPENNLRIKLS